MNTRLRSQDVRRIKYSNGANLESIYIAKSGRGVEISEGPKYSYSKGDRYNVQFDVYNRTADVGT